MAQVQSSSASSKAKIVTTATIASSTSDILSLMERMAVLKQNGQYFLLPGHDTIHGYPCKENCHASIQVVAQLWFGDRFDEGFCKGFC